MRERGPVSRCTVSGTAPLRGVAPLCTESSDASDRLESILSLLRYDTSPFSSAFPGNQDQYVI